MRQDSYDSIHSKTSRAKQTVHCTSIDGRLDESQLQCLFEAVKSFLILYLNKVLVCSGALQFVVFHKRSPNAKTKHQV